MRQYDGFRLNPQESPVLVGLDPQDETPVVFGDDPVRWPATAPVPDPPAAIPSNLAALPAGPDRDRAIARFNRHVARVKARATVDRILRRNPPTAPTIEAPPPQTSRAKRNARRKATIAAKDDAPPAPPAWLDGPITAAAVA